jgi:hypothetical protein
MTENYYIFLTFCLFFYFSKTSNFVWDLALRGEDRSGRRSRLMPVLCKIEPSDFSLKFFPTSQQLYPNENSGDLQHNAVKDINST